jgi:hypothetical protein
MTSQDLKEEQHQVVRQDVWVKALVAVAGAINCLEPQSAVKWADDCLAAFDTRFKAPIVDKDLFQNQLIEAKR